MRTPDYSWEERLVSKAINALAEQERPAHLPRLDPQLLAESYQACKAMTARHSRSFSLAAALLPPQNRAAIYALYAFCRTSDDLVDHPHSHTYSDLAEWRKASLDDDPHRHAGITPAWIHTRMTYQVPLAYAQQLFDGVSLDLTTNRYGSFDELATYCYGVASTVGLMYMSIVGYQSREAIPYAVKMGIALQMTNILRDIAEDWHNDRLYLPLDELAEFDINEEFIQRGEVTENWRRFMRFQIERVDRLYEESLPGIAFINREGQFALYAAADFYRGILRDIEKHEYDVFTRRAHLSGFDKISRIPGIWLRLKQLRTLRPLNAERVRSY